MTPRDFAYWLQGFFEIANPTILNSAQMQMLQEHLVLVFRHEAKLKPKIKSPTLKDLWNLEKTKPNKKVGARASAREVVYCNKSQYPKKICKP